MPVRLSAALVAEFVGTFALTFVGILAIHNAPADISNPNNHLGLLMVAIAHGLTLAIMVTAAMPTSGGHLNPAVTFGFLVTGKIKPPAAIAYIVIQLLGGAMAALAVYVISGDMHIVAQGTPMPGAGVGAGAAVLAEIIATIFLVGVVWGTAADPRARSVGGFAIGLTIAIDILAVGPITGASMNPARSFGPTLVANLPELWHKHWIYWVGPLAGAGIAAITYHLVLWPRDVTKGIDPAAVNVPKSQSP